MKRHLIIIAVLALLVPGALLAQDELTLEGLAEQVANLADRVTTIEFELAEKIIILFCMAISTFTLKQRPSSLTSLEKFLLSSRLKQFLFILIAVCSRFCTLNTITAPSNM